MKKHLLNKNGFVLVETLVVAVAVSLIFALIFKHFFPLIGEYEVRENYDDIDSKYGVYWIKKIIENPSYKLSFSSPVTQFDCSNIQNNDVFKNECYQMIESLEVSCDKVETPDKIEACSDQINNKPHIYITNYKLSDFKARVADNTYYTYYTSGFRDYVNYLPTYKKVDSPNGARYRIVVEYYRHRFDTEYYNSNEDSYKVDSNDFLTFSTIEVKK